MTKQHITLFSLYFLFQITGFSLQAQGSYAPVTVSLSNFLEGVTEKLDALATDSNVTFEQVKPFFAAAFENYRGKMRRQRAAAETRATRYLVIVTLDGLRWQEVFNGADSALLADPAYTPDSTMYRNKYWAATPEARRVKLLPFFWSTLQSQGQLYGNRRYRNCVNVSNRMWFSYPGYNEMFSGAPDDKRIFSNLKLPNPNSTVLDFLNRQRGFRNRVAVFSTWDAFPAIFNEKRTRLAVTTADEVRRPEQVYGCPDEPTWLAARSHLFNRRPRVVFISFDETDHQAHEGRYDACLDAAHRTDAWLADLWQRLQSDRRYRGRTTLLITTDHGRGNGTEWRDHRAGIAGSDAIWLAAIGPDTPPTGEVKEPGQHWQKQLAQTIAGLLGQHFQCDHAVAPAIETIFTRRSMLAAALGARK